MTSTIQPELSIVIPVYNEGEAVEPVLRALRRRSRPRTSWSWSATSTRDTTVPVVDRLMTEIPASRAPQRPRPRRPQRHEGGDRRDRGPLVLISMADGSDEPPSSTRWSRSPAGERTSSPPAATCGAATRSADRSEAPAEPGGGPQPPLGRRRGDPRPDEQLQALPPHFLDAVPIESRAGFELALELTVKATLAGRRVAEVPTTWRDRTAGQSNFRLRKWLPHYLRWYAVAMRGRLRRLVGGVPPEHVRRYERLSDFGPARRVPSGMT